MIDLKDVEGIVKIPYVEFTNTSYPHIKNAPKEYEFYNDECNFTFNIICPTRTLRISNGL